MNFDNYYDGDLPKIERMHMDYNLTDQAYTFHLHKNVTELVYIASGSGIYMINRQHFDVKKGDVLVIESGLIHSGASSLQNPMKTLVLVVSGIKWKDSNMPDTLILPESFPLIRDGIHTPYISNTMMELWRMYRDDSSDEDLSRMILAPMLVLIRKYYSDTKPYWKVPKESPAADILSYIYTHYYEDISLESLSEHFFLSAGHISHIMQKEFQISPINYLIDVRFSKSKALLINTNMPINEIAERVGYSNPAHFTKMFIKRIGYSPIDYRKLHKNLPDDI